jgi:type II secretory pathway component GspD/PulD (secretin)
MAQTQVTKEQPAPFEDNLVANEQTQAKLEQISKVDFTEVPLKDVLEFLGDQYKVQFYIDKKALSDASVSLDTPITFRLSRVPGEMILRLVLKELNLTYCLEHGVIMVSTEEEANNRLETRIYRLEELIEPSNGTNVIANAQYDRLIDLIAATIKPTTWDRNDGPASMVPYRGTLVISQTNAAHRAIQKLLDNLKESMNKDCVDEAYVQPVSNTRKNLAEAAAAGVGGHSGANKSDSSKQNEAPKK